MRHTYNVSTILLATDSAAVLREMAAGGARDGWRVVALQFNVATVEGSVGVNMDVKKRANTKPTYIEHRLRNRDPTLDRATVLTR